MRGANTRTEDLPNVKRLGAANPSFLAQHPRHGAGGAGADEPQMKLRT